MAIRTSLLSTRNINLDTDFSKYIETVSEPGVIEGFELVNSNIGVGKARVPCERTNGETIYALVQNFNEVSISGNGYVIISISQTIIDDGSLGNEDGTGIATVEVVSELPTKNYLELYEISELGLITDKRNMIKKVGELNTAIVSMQGEIDDLDERVQALETAGAIDHLEEQGLVGELYTMSDTLFMQKTPKLSDCIVEDCKVGNTANNTEIHIQRIASGQASDTLKLKIKAVGSPTTALKVEVRSGIQVTVTANSEAYWYGDSENILATGSIPYSDITTSWKEIEVELDNAIGGTKGDLLNIVCYQESSGSAVVNADNYYILACDMTQWSEAFSFVSVNGTTRTRSKLMPYCIGDGLADKLICKLASTSVKGYAVETINLPNEKTFDGLSQGSEKDDEETKYMNIYSEAQTLSFVGDWYRMYSNYPYYTIIYYNLNGVENDFLSSYTSSSSWYNNQGLNNISVPSGAFWCIRWSGSYQNANNAARGRRRNVVISISGNKDLYKSCDVSGKPKEVKNLGDISYMIIFGISNDGDWFDGSSVSNFFKQEKVIDITSNQNKSYIVPCDGFISYDIFGVNNSYPTKLKFNGVTYISEETQTATKGIIPIKKGVLINCTTANSSNYAKVTFFAYQDF